MGAGGKRQLVAWSSSSFADRNEQRCKLHLRYRRPQKRTRMSGSLWRKRKQLMLASVNEVPAPQPVTLRLKKNENIQTMVKLDECSAQPTRSDLACWGMAVGNLAMLCRIRVKQIIDIAWKEQRAQMSFLFTRLSGVAAYPWMLRPRNVPSGKEIISEGVLMLSASLSSCGSCS